MADPMIVTPGQSVAPPEWDALTKQHGGVKSSVPIPLTDPAMQALIQANPDHDFTQQPAYRYYFADGSYATVFTLPNGQDSQVVDYHPSPTFTQQQTQAQKPTEKPTTPHVEGTPTGQRDAQGNPIYDNTKPIVVNRDANGNQVGEAKPLTGPERQQWEREKNGGLTDEEMRQQQATKTVPQAVKGGDGKDYIRSITYDASGRIVGIANVDAATGQPVASIPGEAAKPVVQTVKGGDGKDYFRVVTTDGAGNISVKFLGPDGKPVSEIPGEQQKPSFSTATRNGQTYIVSTQTDPKDPGRPIVRTFDSNGNEQTGGLPAESKPTETYRDKDGELHEIVRNPDGTVKEDRVVRSATTPTGPGPSAPEIIVGHSQQALRQFADDLQQQVAAGTITTAERDKRWAQATQLATVAYNDASLLENARQSDQTAAVSLSNNRLSNATSGFNTALQVVANLNGKLQPGSDLGGKAFAALLGLQVMHAQRMGAYDAGPTPQMRPSQLPGTGGPTSAGSSAPAAPSSATTPPSTSAAPAAAAPATNDATPPPSLIRPASEAPPAEPVSAPVASTNPAGGPEDVIVLSSKASPEVTLKKTKAQYDAMDPRDRALWNIASVNGQPVGNEAPPAPAAAPAAPAPAPSPAPSPVSEAPSRDDWAVLSKMRAPEAPVQEAPVAPSPDFAALQPYQQPESSSLAVPPSDVAATPGADPSGQDMPPALLNTIAQTTPPWRLTESLYRRMRAAGVPDSVIWSTPNRGSILA